MDTKLFYNTAPDPEFTPEQPPQETPQPEIPMEDPTPMRFPETPGPDRFPEENPLPAIQPEFPGTPSPGIQRF